MQTLWMAGGLPGDENAEYGAEQDDYLPRQIRLRFHHHQLEVVLPNEQQSPNVPQLFLYSQKRIGSIEVGFTHQHSLQVEFGQPAVEEGGHVQVDHHGVSDLEAHRG